MSNVRQLYDEGICTNGCSVGDPHVNPTINDVQLPTFQGVGHWVSAHICINIPDGKEKKHTETMLDQLMDTMEAYFPNMRVSLVSRTPCVFFAMVIILSSIPAYLLIGKVVMSVQNDIDAKTNWFGRSNLTYFKFYPHVSSYARWVELDYEKYISGFIRS